MNNDPEQFRDLMRRVYDEMREGLREEVDAKTYRENRELFAFHMSDWLDDYLDLKTLVESPQSTDADDAAEVVARFLYHVVPHTTEAGRLLLDDVPNPFAVDRRDQTTGVSD